MEGLKAKLVALVKDEEGLELSEYAVAGAVIVLMTLAAFQGLSGAITGAITRITNVITGAGAAAPAGG